MEGGNVVLQRKANLPWTNVSNFRLAYTQLHTNFETEINNIQVKV